MPACYLHVCDSSGINISLNSRVRNLLLVKTSNPEPIFNILIPFSYTRVCTKATVSGKKFLFFLILLKNCCVTELCVISCRFGVARFCWNGKQTQLIPRCRCSFRSGHFYGRFCVFAPLRILEFHPKKTLLSKFLSAGFKTYKKSPKPRETLKTVINI